MLFILPSILILGAVLLAIWAIFFRAAWRNERAAQAAHARTAEIETRISTPGEPLFCIACRRPVVAPLTCPQCDSQAFLVPASMCNDPLAQAVPTVATAPTAPVVISPPVRSPRRVVRVGKNT